MRTKQLFSTFLVVATQLCSSGVSESTQNIRGYISKQSKLGERATTVNGSSDIEASHLNSSSSSITFPESTLQVMDSLVTELQPITTPTPTHTPAPTTMSSNIAALASIVIEEYNNESSSSFQLDELNTAIESASSSNFPSNETLPAPKNKTQSIASSFLNGTSLLDNGEVLIAKPSSDSSSFRLVESKNCSVAEVDNIYTLYTNSRPAFDLCVSASSYQIFPYPGDHPTQAQIRRMAELDACIAMFSIVIQTNFPACCIGDMPLVSAVETLLKISVDLKKGLEDKAPSTEVFLKLLIWRYQVDLARAANVPHDESSQLYAEFETNLDAAMKNTTIRVNEDLTVDVRLPNGSYETFEDAVDLVVLDASAVDLMPGYVVARSQVDVSSSSASSSSRDATDIAIESSSARANCTPNLWSFIVVSRLSCHTC